MNKGHSQSSIAGSMVLDKLFGMFNRLLNKEHDPTRPEKSGDPVRARLHRLRSAKGGPDCPNTTDTLERSETDSAASTDAQAKMRQKASNSGGFPRQEPSPLSQ